MRPNNMQLELLRIMNESYEKGDSYEEYHAKVDAAWKDFLTKDEDEE